MEGGSLMLNISAMPGYIPLGNQRDFGHTIQVDLTAWADINADDWKITYTRPGESATYPVPDGDVSVADNVLTWTISEAVTAINGAGSVVIEAYRGGEMLKHSDRIMTIIGEGHEPAGEAPEPVEDWIADATQKLAEVDPALGLAAAATLAANTAAGRADTIAGTLEGIAPKWADVDISVSALVEGSDPTASITQDETGTSISLGIPKGDTGAQGPVGNVMYATFDIDFDTGELVMTIPDGYTGPTFSINDETGELEVSI
jgi:hypothetical protein